MTTPAEKNCEWLCQKIEERGLTEEIEAEAESLFEKAWPMFPSMGESRAT